LFIKEFTLGFEFFGLLLSQQFNKAVVRSNAAGLESWELVDEDPIRIH
jgi:hypothetical protein